MASNVFGTPITKEYLMEMGEGCEFSQLDRARVALRMKNEYGKDLSAREFVVNLKKRLKRICTMGLIYNATGDPITFYADHDWVGRLCESPYPVIIQNGQWGAFLHGQDHPDGSKGSKAAIIYSGNNSDGEDCLWVMCFFNNYHGSFNEVHTEVCKPSDYNLHLNESADWDSLEYQLSSNESKLVTKANQNGGLLFGSMGNISYTQFEGILTLPEALD